MDLVSTNWEILGSSGATARFGTPGLRVELGGGNIKLPIRSLITEDVVELAGIGAGVSIGAGISLPFANASWSGDDFPASRIGSIYAGYDRPETGQYQRNDFFGGLIVQSLGAGKQISGNICCAIWMSDPVEICALRLSCTKAELMQIANNVGAMVLRGGVVPFGVGRYQVERFLKSTKAVGFFTGISLETQLLGVSANAYYYRVSA